MLISQIGRSILDSQNLVRVVRIIEVNTNATPYPVAIGVDDTNAEHAINLRFLPPGLKRLPSVGDFWWVETRFGRFWTLLNEETTDAVGLAPGTSLESEAVALALTGPITSVGNATTITDLAVTTEKVADLAITTAKLDAEAVTLGKLALGATSTLALNAQIGTTYTLALTDIGLFVTCSNGSDITVTIPVNSTIAFPIGSQVNIMQLGAGQVTLSPFSGTVLLRSAGAKLKTTAQYSVATVLKIATNTWVCVGSLSV